MNRSEEQALEYNDVDRRFAEFVKLLRHIFFNALSLLHSLIEVQISKFELNFKECGIFFYE